MDDQITLVKRGVRTFIVADGGVQRWINFTVCMAAAAASSWVVAQFRPTIGASMMIATLLGALWGLMGAWGATIRERECPECESSDTSAGETTHLHVCYSCGNRWATPDPGTLDDDR